MRASLRGIQLRRIRISTTRISPSRFANSNGSGFHSTRIPLKDSEDDGSGGSSATKSNSGGLTAESVILHRVNSPSIHPSFSHLKNDKETVKDQQQQHSDDGLLPSPGGSNYSGGGGGGESISSVSGIINSVRETRAASQRSPWHKKEISSNNNNDGLVDDDGEPSVSPSLFDTYEVVRNLVDAGFTRSQATSIMTVIKRRVYEGVEWVRGQMLTRSDLDNDAYLFRAALQELRMEMQMTRKNDQSILESQAAAISREIESLAQRTNDQIANLRSDIEIEMNNHKHETSHELKGMDMELHELATKYQMLMGEMKTDIEAIKLGSIRRGLITVVLTAMFLSAIFWGPHIAQRVKDRRRQRRKNQKQQIWDAEGKRVSDDEEEEEPADLTMTTVTAATDDDDVLDGSSSSIRPSDSGSELAAQVGTAVAAAAAAAAGTAYRDYSHLNIKYRPAVSGKYDDWFDSAYYHDNNNNGSASLIDSDDSQVDSAIWNNSHPSPPPSSQPIPTRIPLLFTPPNSNNNTDNESNRD